MHIFMYITFLFDIVCCVGKESTTKKRKRKKVNGDVQKSKSDRGLISLFICVFL